MNINRSAVATAVVLAIGAGYGLYRLGLDRGAQTAAASVAAPALPMPVTAPAGGENAAAGKKILYWHDPMVPGQKFDKPGKSPFMDMDLVPVYAEEGGDQGSVAISARMQQNLGVRTAEVTRHALAPTVEAVGTVAYNERDVAVVQARNSGFVERLFVRAPLDPVRQGQPLAEMYVPDWVAAQEEYLSVARMAECGRTGGRRAPAHAAGRHVRRTDPVGRGKRQGAGSLHGDGADRRRGGRTRRARGNDGGGGRAALPHQRAVDRVGERRGAGEPRRAGEAGERGRGARAGARADDVQGQGHGDPAGGQSRHAHAEGARRTRQSGRRAWFRACSPR